MSDPGTVSPSILVCPVEQARHTLDDTYISNAHAQAVSEPVALSPAAFADPTGHDVHALEDTYSFASHVVHVHDPVVPPTVPPFMQ